MMIKIFVFCLMLFPLTISAAWELCPTGAPYVQFGFADESYLYFITTGIPGVEKMKMYRTGNFGGDWEEVPLPVRGKYVYWKCNVAAAFEIKSSSKIDRVDRYGLRAFAEMYLQTSGYIIRLAHNTFDLEPVRLLPWREYPDILEQWL